MSLLKPQNHRETKVVFNVLSKYTVYIVFTHDIPASANYLSIRDKFNSLNDDRMTHCFGCHLNPYERGDAYLLFTPEITVGGIAHECWHAVHAMFDWAGMELENETVAYHLGYLVNAVINFHAKAVSPEEYEHRRIGKTSGKRGTGRTARDSDKERSGSTRIYDFPKIWTHKGGSRQTHQ
jgi:hypothetical protein